MTLGQDCCVREDSLLHVNRGARYSAVWEGDRRYFSGPFFAPLLGINAAAQIAP